MKFPLVIEQFQKEPEFEKISDKEFLQLFINAINSAYEIGKRAAHSGFCLTAAMIKAWQKREYRREMQGETDKMFLDVFTKCSNGAYQQGVKDSGRVFKASETYHRALTEQEQKDFMQEMAQDYYYKFVSLLLCTGMRSGEAAALTWINSPSLYHKYNDISHKM
ncbi:MAG: hypothetical protein K2L86_16065 [Lachnospiraceae bacterium]|nr:hypothetical protein [Lachnospiraceae bacterium]